MISYNYQTFWNITFWNITFWIYIIFSILPTRYGSQFNKKVVNFDNCLYVLFKSYQNVSLLLKFVPFKSSRRVSTTNLRTPILGKCKNRSPKVSGSQRIFTYVDGPRQFNLRIPAETKLSHRFCQISIYTYAVRK